MSSFRGITPVHPNRRTHAALALIQAGSTQARQFTQIAACAGVPLSLPYFDDQVMNACLSVRPADLLDPARYKPLIVEAMRGIVPDGVLARTTKAETSMAVEQGFVENRHRVLSLIDDSRLAALGLIDAGRFRDVCRGRVGVDDHLGPLAATVACEMWLRSLDNTPWQKSSSTARRNP